MIDCPDAYDDFLDTLFAPADNLVSPYTARPGFQCSQPSTRQLLREHVCNLRPLVLRPIVNTKQEITMNQDFDENDGRWADRDLIGQAILLVGVVLALAGLFLWGGW